MKSKSTLHVIDMQVLILLYYVSEVIFQIEFIIFMWEFISAFKSIEVTLNCSTLMLDLCLSLLIRNNSYVNLPIFHVQSMTNFIPNNQ